MSKLTKEQWGQIDVKLSGAYGLAELLVDGYRVTLAVQSIARFKQAIIVYVNGKIDFSMNKESEEARRFWQLRRKYIYPAKYRKRIKRMNKALREGIYEDIDWTIDSYWPWWTSFRSLKAHLIKNNESIELIEDKKP